MAAFGTWIYNFTNSPIEVATGRTRSLPYSGRIGGVEGAFLDPPTMGGPGGIPPASPGHGYSAENYPSVWMPWQDPGTMAPSVKIESFAIPPAVYLRTTVDIFGTSAYADSFLAADRHNWLASEEAVFSATCDVEEFTILQPGDALTFVYIEGVPYSIFGGNGMPDGPPGTRRTFYERLKVGGEITVTAGEASVTVPITVASIVSTYQVTYNLEGRSTNVANSGLIEVEWNDGNGSAAGFPTQTVTEAANVPAYIGESTVVTASTSSGFTVNATTDCPETELERKCDASYSTTGSIGPSIARRYQVEVKCGPDPHPGGLYLSCETGSVALSGGTAYIDQDIRSWGFQAYCNTTLGPFSSSPDVFSPARMWLSGMAHTGTEEDPEVNDTDDRHDHSLPILGERFAVGELTHDSIVTVLTAGDSLWEDEASSSGSGIVLNDSHTSASASLTYPKSVFEAYRDFRLPLTLTGSAPRTVTITLANPKISKSYEVEVAPGVAFTDFIDTQLPSEVPSGFNVDRRSSSYPVTSQVGGVDPWGPLVGGPDEGSDLDGVEGFDDDPETVRGWLWGANRIETVTVSCPLESGESLLVGALTLVRTDEPKITLKNEFTAGATGYDGMRPLGKEQAVEGGSEVASITGGTHAFLRVDTRIRDFPSVWRRIPAIGSSGPVFTNLREFGEFWNSLQGCTFTEASDPDSPYLDNSAFGLYMAWTGFTVSYDTDGTPTFESWHEHPLGALYANESIGEVVDYAAMGNPLAGSGGEFGFRTVYACAKQIRTWAEGRAFNPDTREPNVGATISTTQEGTASGSGVTDSQGLYKTEAPRWWGNGRDHAIVSPGYTDDPRKGFNRRSVRASFLFIPGVAGDGVALLHTPDEMWWRAAIETAGLTVRTAIIAGPKPGYWTTVVVSNSSQDRSPCLTWDPTNNRAHLLWDRDDGIYESYSDSDGATWSDPALSDLIPGGFMPKRRHSYPDGDALHVAIVDDSGGGAGKLVGRYRGRGDLDWGTAYDLTIHPDSPIDPDTVLRVDGTAAAPKGYDIFHGQSSDGRVSLSIRRLGDTDTTDWFSVDDGRLWWPAT